MIKRLFILFSILLIIEASSAQIFPKPIPVTINITTSCSNNACIITANQGQPHGFNGNNSFQNFNIVATPFINETDCPSITQFSQEVVVPLRNNLTFCQAMTTINQTALMQILDEKTVGPHDVINASELDRQLAINRAEVLNQCQTLITQNITQGVLTDCNQKLENISLISGNYTACIDALRTAREGFENFNTTIVAERRLNEKSLEFNSVVFYVLLFGGIVGAILYMIIRIRTIRISRGT